MLDLLPRIQQRKQSACPHLKTTVSLSENELTCDDCNKVIDPFWYIRREALNREQLDKDRAAAEKEFERWKESVEQWKQQVRAREVYYNEKIQKLTDRYNKLMNTQVPRDDGQPGTWALANAGRRRRTTTRARTS